MKQYFTIFGSHPDLSLAELMSVEPNLNDFRLAGLKSAVFESQTWNPEVMMDRLGGTVKLGEVMLTTKLGKLDVQTVIDLMAARSPEHKKIQFGWTVFSAQKNQKLENFPLKIKKGLKELGIASRWVTGEHGAELSPAAVAKCELTEEPNVDVCVLINKDQVAIGFTTHVQDADAWSLRDYGRPCRDDENGMLPPKLARMLVNLAQTKNQAVIIDPFCGSGTVLMEAGLALSTKKIIGSDISDSLISDAQKNLEWLVTKNILDEATANKVQIFTCDARKISEHVEPQSVDAIISEGTLGPPLHGRETPTQLKKNADMISGLWAESLAEFKKILKPTGVAVIIVPEFKVGNFSCKTDVSKTIKELGFEVIKPAEKFNVSELAYSRPNQFIIRHIFVLELK